MIAADDRDIIREITGPGNAKEFIDHELEL